MTAFTDLVDVAAERLGGRVLLANDEFFAPKENLLKPGRHVICAVTGKKIPLEALRYWNSATQEAYAGATEALQRWKELNP